MRFLNNRSCLATNKLATLYLILLLAGGFAACRERATTGNKTGTTPDAISFHEGDDQYIAINTKLSLVTWKGSMQIGNNNHRGYVYISKGELRLDNGQLRGGAVEVDMKTIEDLDHRADNNLIKHLKDPDFFDVTKFPTSTISITGSGADSSTPGHSIIFGNLTIKGITNPVSFPARIAVADGLVTANGRLVIDRTKWDVRYKSGKFYDLLADQTMSDSIEFDIKIVAWKR